MISTCSRNKEAKFAYLAMQAKPEHPGKKQRWQPVAFFHKTGLNLCNSMGCWWQYANFLLPV